MRWHLLIFVACAVALGEARNVIRNFPLLQFREIADVKLIYTHENVDVRNYELQRDLDALMKEISETRFENKEFVPERETLIRELKRANITYGNFLLSPPQSKVTSGGRRQKRSWDAFGNALKWMGGVMNAEDRDSMRRYFQFMEDNQLKLNRTMNSILTQLNESDGNSIAEKSFAGEMPSASDLKRFKESLLLLELRERVERISGTINAIMASYVNGRLDSSLIDSIIVQIFAGALNYTVDRPSQFACATPLECIRSAEAKFDFKNGRVQLSLKVPVAQKQSFKLYEASPVPAAYFDHVIIFKPQHKYYAYDEENEELLAFGGDYKRSCSGDSETALFCTTEDVVSSVSAHDCLLTAIRDRIVDTEICAGDMQLYQLDDLAVIKFDQRRFWIHSELPVSLQTRCMHGEGDEEAKNITGNLIVDLKFECRGSINNLRLVTYALNEDQHFVTAFSANISKESFRDVINTMAAASILSSDSVHDLDTMKVSGLREKNFAPEETLQAKNQWQEKEIQVLHAEHNKFIIIALVVAVCALLFMVFQRRKSIFIVASQRREQEREEREEIEEAPPQYSEEKDESDASLKMKSSYN